ncbi:MAG: biosynthetic arginine decarboxylase [Planctomycetota bacterium]
MKGDWSIKDSAELYRISSWASDYFKIDEKGTVAVTPMGATGPSVSLYEIARGIEERGLTMPVLLRIENILGSQIRKLHTSFSKAISETGYTGVYKGVYPIKVNQQEQVIEAVAQYGRPYNHGLEAGSKPELIAAISMLDNRDACIICNGYKDEEFIDLGLYATKMGFNCFFVVEMPTELEVILERANKLSVRPNIGVRIKLSAKADGKWSQSGGDTSVFGLTMSQVDDAVDQLKKAGMLDCLKLLHYHIGSQIPNIRDIRVGVQEACRIYEEIISEGAPMGYLDLGGGLAVDYDGSNSNRPASCNYTLDEYCYDVVEMIKNAFEPKRIPHPTIITESGRATVAYYSVLLFNILDVCSYTPAPLPETIANMKNSLLTNMHEAYASISDKTIQECYNDSQFYLSQARLLFKQGQITLRERAIAEDLHRHTMNRISMLSKRIRNLPTEIDTLSHHLSDVYYGNFSLFQSLPDVWAIDQVFPIMPIHRLDEEPTCSAVISDITCDCDGKIDKFPGFVDEGAILLHPLRNREEYYLGAFLVGAYQETLGDLHNLFGDTNVVSINISEDGSYEFIREQAGDAVTDVLSYVGHDVRDLKKRLTVTAEAAVKSGAITIRDRKEILESFDEGLRGYTYFEREY